MVALLVVVVWWCCCCFRGGGVLCAPTDTARYREREKEVDQELALYESMCAEIRGQLRSAGGSSSSSRGAGRHIGDPQQEIAAVMEENAQLREQIAERQRMQRH